MKPEDVSTAQDIFDFCDNLYGPIHGPSQLEWIAMAVTFRDNPIHASVLNWAIVDRLLKEN